MDKTELYGGLIGIILLVCLIEKVTIMPVTGIVVGSVITLCIAEFYFRKQEKTAIRRLYYEAYHSIGNFIGQALNDAVGNWFDSINNFCKCVFLLEDYSTMPYDTFERLKKIRQIYLQIDNESLNESLRNIALEIRRKEYARLPLPGNLFNPKDVF